MDKIAAAAELIAASDNIVAFTGAGVSTESDIPDFRSAAGLFKSSRGSFDHPPEVMLSHSFFMEQPDVFYEYYKSKLLYRDARPNRCHTVFAGLEGMGKLKAVVTQNIDGLHQAAGSRNVLELHGSVHRNYCIKCKKSFSLDYVVGCSSAVPLCDRCGGMVRPDVVLYEEMLDNGVLDRAIGAIRAADFLIVAGTSLVVYPAAGLVNYYRGHRLILVNKSETPFDSRADLVINGSAGEVMGRIMSPLV